MLSILATLDAPTEPKMAKLTINGPMVVPKLFTPPAILKRCEPVPGRADHPQAKLVAKQMTGGSNLIAFEIAGGKAEAFRFQDALRIVKISNNLGDAKSLITHPATTTHQRLTPAQRAELGISDGMVRLSVGLEHQDDLLEDVLGALAAV
jgi:O-succinylhomoserine sulfhydrylase